MQAIDLGPEHIGKDITISIGSLLTGGILRDVSHRFGIVSMDLDGQIFDVDEGKHLQVLEPAEASKLFGPPVAAEARTERHLVGAR